MSVQQKAIGYIAIRICNAYIFIHYAKQLGFMLEMITELLSISIYPEHHTCKEVEVHC